MTRFLIRPSSRARLLAAFVVGAAFAALAGCSHPEETPSPSPTAAAATAPAGAPGTANTANPPGGPQGDAAYYQKTYANKSGAPR